MEDIKTALTDLIGLEFNKLIHEIELYFQVVKKIIFDDVKKRLDIPKEEYLRKHNLVERNLNNVLFLPEILKLAEEIKENNFNEFKNYWFTEDYFHHTHGYLLKELLNNLGKYSDVVEKLRIRFLDHDEKATPQSGFIDQDFKSVGLHLFEDFKELINQISTNKDFIKTLPILLRILFENILYQIFLTGLDNKYKLYFFNQNKKRPRDFSELIALLNILKEREFKMYDKGVIVQSHIEELKFFKDLGNYEVHQIFTRIDPSFPIQYKEKVNSILRVLLNLYSNLNNEKISLSSETIDIIENKIAKTPEKKNKIMHNKEMLLEGQSPKEKAANDFYQYLHKLFSRFEEVGKPPNDNNFKDNANYIYFKFEIRDEGHHHSMSQDKARHLMIDAKDRLKNFYSKVCELSYEEIKDKLHDYSLKFADYRIKIEVHKVSIHRSKQYLFSESPSLKEVLDYILSEIINLSLQQGVKIQYGRVIQKLSNEKIEIVKMHFNELFGFLDDLFYNRINSNKLRSIISYISNNEQDFDNYLTFQREPTSPNGVQNFYFLRGKYRIHFFSNQKPNIYVNFDESHFSAEEEPEKVKEAYSKLKFELTEHLRNEFKIDLE